MKAEDYEILGKRAYNEKNYKDAANYFTKALELRMDKNLLYEIGLTFYKLQNYDDAIKYLRKALELDSKFKEAWETLADALCLVWKFREAVKCYEKAYELSYEPSLKEKITSLRLIWDY
ncbi:MAG: tetratricopeptide repeat protein [Candidatus Thermoplasmatota archaeon]|nr:tetratricopeptide repeat protein [Candidatus Thermoplasmatota archaeon]MDI6855605.1 tetratricopeptide repeat protein [Candidatus Thermoplasmatota archaeon]